MKKEKLKIFRDLLLVRRLKPAEAKPYEGSGLIIEMAEESRYCDVLEVGPDVRGVKPGDRIMLMGECPGGQDFHFNGELLLVMREKYVFGVME